MDFIQRIKNGEFENLIPFVPKGEGRKLYAIGNQEARARFHKALAEEFGLVGHPKEEKLFEIAWDQAHANGLESVYYHYEEISPLLM